MPTVSLQDRMYQELRDYRIKAKLYLVNGFQLEGIIREFDNFTVLVLDKGTEKLIFKHAISTIEQTIRDSNEQLQPRKAPVAASSGYSLQDRMYLKLKETQVKARLYLVNGYQLEGTVSEYDNFTVEFNDGDKKRLIFKHAVSTIEPSRAVMY